MNARWISQLISDLLSSPKLIILLCLVFAWLGVLFDGTLYRIWELKTEQKKVQTRVIETQGGILKLKKQIQLANDPTFIKREAKERFDLVEEDDLIFVFSDEN